MADLWIFGRRPAALVRHRHGGFNATFPMNSDTVVEQAGRTRAAHAERSAVETPLPVEGHEATNVLPFQPRAERGKRGGPGSGGRATGRPAPYRD